MGCPARAKGKQQMSVNVTGTSSSVAGTGVQRASCPARRPHGRWGAQLSSCTSWVDPRLVGGVLPDPPVGSKSVPAVRMGFSCRPPLKPFVPEPFPHPCAHTDKTEFLAICEFSEVYFMSYVRDDDHLTHVCML